MELETSILLYKTKQEGENVNTYFMLVNKNHNCFVAKLQRKARQPSEHVEYMVFNTTAMFYLGCRLKVYLLFFKRKIFTLSKQIVLINMNMQNNKEKEIWILFFCCRNVASSFWQGDEKKLWTWERDQFAPTAHGKSKKTYWPC